MARLSRIDPASLIEGLATTPDLEDPHYRMGWPSFVELMTRLRQQAGGLEQLEEVGNHSTRAASGFAALSPVFDHPMELLRFGLAAWLPASISTIRCTLTVKDERSARYELHFSPLHEDCPELARIQAGGIRTFPESIGHPPAKVSATYAPRFAAYDILLAPPKKGAKTKPQPGKNAVLSDVAGSLTYAFHELAVIARTTSEAQVMREIENQRTDALVQLGFALASTADRKQRMGLWAEMLSGLKGCERAEVIGTDGLTGASGDAQPHGQLIVRQLKIADRKVGEVRAWLSERPEELTQSIDRMTPWVAMGIAAGVELERFEPSKEGDGFPSKFARAGQIWDLTERQAQVLALLVRGKSNKEIAAQLTCAERTVEIHVTHLLRKSSAGSRAMITAKFWTEL